MKRFIFSILAVLLLAFLAGCSAKESEKAPAAAEAVDVIPEVTVEVEAAEEVSIELSPEGEDAASSCDDEIYDEANDSLLGGIGITLAPLPEADLQIAMLLSGSREEAFAALGYEAIMEIADAKGLEAEVRENVKPETAEAALEELLQAGYDFIFIHGEGIAEAMDAAAAAYPEAAFCIIGGMGEVELGRSNVGCVNVLDTGVLLGATMAALSENQKICLLTDGEGMEVQNGMRLADAACSLILVSTEDADFEEKIRAAIKDGADVLASDSVACQETVASIAKEAGIYAIGCGLDAYAYAPEAVVLSLIPDYSFLYTDMLQRYLDGEYTDSIYNYGLSEGALRLGSWNGWDEKLPEKKVDAIDQIVEMLFSGEAFDF